MRVMFGVGGGGTVEVRTPGGAIHAIPTAATASTATKLHACTSQYTGSSRKCGSITQRTNTTTDAAEVQGAAWRRTITQRSVGERVTHSMLISALCLCLLHMPLAAAAGVGALPTWG